MDQKIDYYIDQRLQKQSDSSMSTELSFETDIVCKHFTEAIKSNVILNYQFRNMDGSGFAQMEEMIASIAIHYPKVIHIIT